MDDGETIHKTDDEWRKQLSEAQYCVTREKGTEAPFTGEHHGNEREGTYTCVCCQAELFDSEAKFDSGSGWPSFCKPIEGRHIVCRRDDAYGTVCVEVTCARCEAHLGHVFRDGPAPTGLRYCINSAALDFEEADGEEA